MKFKKMVISSQYLARRLLFQLFRSLLDTLYGNTNAVYAGLHPVRHDVNQVLRFTAGVVGYIVSSSLETRLQYIYG